MSTNGATRYEVQGGVATITLDEPDNRNALSRTLLAGTVEDLDKALADDTVRAVVVTNSGRVFCAGADLNAPPSSASGSDAGKTPDMSGLMSMIMTAPKPMIARIAGHCSGGGVGLAASFDISVADETMKFGFTEARIGVAPAIISVVCLPKLRRADALELFLRADRFPATKAAEIGLINRAVPADALDDEVAAILADVVRGGPAALAACKHMINTVPAMETAEAFARMTRESLALFEGDEAKAGIAAYLAKTNPPWIPGPA